MKEARGSAHAVDGLAAALRAREDWARDLLCRLISIRSMTGDEGAVQSFLGDYLSRSGFAPRLSPIDNAIRRDRDYSPLPGSPSYAGRPNVMLDIGGAGGGRTLVLNTHVDVVPGPDELFAPRVEGRTVVGRGACDAKGQVVTAVLALLALKDLGLRLKGEVKAQFVIEEEAGGNGSLAAITAGERAEAAIVLEPTGLGVRPANRGAAWFRLSVSGRSVHMGRYSEGVNAVEEMVGLVACLKEYEGFLRGASKGYPGFPDEPSPVVVNVGRIQGGDWPSTVPAECVVEGGIAFLPNRSARQVEDEVRALIKARATPWAREHARFELAGLRNEAFVTPFDSAAVVVFKEAAEAVLGRAEIAGWPASCDGRLFFHRGGMPTIVFGAGDLRHAHSFDERIDLGDILRAAEVIARFVASWCGVEAKESGHAG